MPADGPYSDWTDSTAEPFLRSMMEDGQNRDHHRLAFADWLEEQGLAAEAEHFRSPYGFWNENGVLSWQVMPHANGNPRGSGRCTPLTWNAWAWLLPKPEWLESARCEELVAAWVRNRCGDSYWWEPLVRKRIEAKRVRVLE